MRERDMSAIMHFARLDLGSESLNSLQCGAIARIRENKIAVMTTHRRAAIAVYARNLPSLCAARGGRFGPWKLLTPVPSSSRSCDLLL